MQPDITEAAQPCWNTNTVSSILDWCTLVVLCSCVQIRHGVDLRGRLVFGQCRQGCARPCAHLELPFGLLGLPTSKGHLLSVSTVGHRLQMRPAKINTLGTTLECKAVSNISQYGFKITIASSKAEARRVHDVVTCALLPGSQPMRHIKGLPNAALVYYAHAALCNMQEGTVILPNEAG